MEIVLGINDGEDEIVQEALRAYGADCALAKSHGHNPAEATPIAGICSAYLKIRQTALSPAADFLLKGSVLSSIVDPKSHQGKPFEPPDAPFLMLRIISVLKRLDYARLNELTRAAEGLARDQGIKIEELPAHG